MAVDSDQATGPVGRYLEIMRYSQPSAETLKSIERAEQQRLARREALLASLALERSRRSAGKTGGRSAAS